MSEAFFVIGLGAGGLLGAAIAIMLAERRVEQQVASWEDLLTVQSGKIAELREHRTMPRAVTKLTNRTKTVEIQ
jgi:hypothetical protein